ncbi:MAG: hypothetical protein ACR2G0_01450 [Chthoniobacterales bacterium]
MKIDLLLERIFRLARRVPAGTTEIPFGLETAVLAHWREARAKGSINSGLLRGLRWAALTACGVALLVGALESEELSAFNNRNDPEARLADSAIVAGYDYE